MKKQKMSGKKGDTDVEEVVTKYSSRLLAFIRKRVPVREDAEDILQDVFYQLVRTVDDATTQIEQVSAWLYRVARNAIINKGKKKREEEFPVFVNGDDDEIGVEFSDILFGDSDTPSTPETEYLRSLVWEELESALSELPAGQREAFELMEIDGLPPKEIAESTGIPVNTLLSRKHYAVKHLRKRLYELYAEMINNS